MPRLNDLLLLALLGGAAIFGVYVVTSEADAPPAPPPPPVKPDRPAPPPPKRPKPWGEQKAAGRLLSLAGAKVSGPKFDDGTEVSCDLPGDLHRKNTASKGLGLCVFTSIHHAAQWQDVPALLEMPKWMISKGIAGGGYPSKVAQLVPRLAQERGMPTPDFVQVESNDLEILKLACSSGRMPCVTYSRSPTGRYGGSRISHMVNIVHASDSWFVVLDNNYVGETAYEWMTPKEFLAAYSGGGTGWSVIFLDSPPPPPPHNGTPQPKEGGDGEPKPIIAAAPECGREACDCGCRSGEACRCAAAARPKKRWVKVCPCSPQCSCGCNEGFTCNCNGPAPDQPAPAPESDDEWKTHGVIRDRVAERPRYRHGDYEVTRDDVIAALTASVPADGKKRRVTVIGSKEDRARIEADWKSNPELAPLRDAYLFKSYDPTHWHVARYGFKLDGKPTVYVQEPDGLVLLRQDDYAGPTEFAAALRRLRPDYDPTKDDAGRLLRGRSGGVPWMPLILVGGAAAAFYVFSRRR